VLERFEKAVATRQGSHESKPKKHPREKRNPSVSEANNYLRKSPPYLENYRTKEISFVAIVKGDARREQPRSSVGDRLLIRGKRKKDRLHGIHVQESKYCEKTGGNGGVKRDVQKSETGISGKEQSADRGTRRRPIRKHRDEMQDMELLPQPGLCDATSTTPPFWRKEGKGIGRSRGRRRATG